MCALYTSEDWIFVYYYYSILIIQNTLKSLWSITDMIKSCSHIFQRIVYYILYSWLHFYIHVAVTPWSVQKIVCCIFYESTGMGAYTCWAIYFHGLKYADAHSDCCSSFGFSLGHSAFLRVTNQTPQLFKFGDGRMMIILIILRRRAVLWWHMCPYNTLTDTCVSNRECLGSHNVPRHTQSIIS